MADPTLVTVPNVEVLEVGEEWETSTGVFTVTQEDLESAIAAQDHPAIRTPVIKFGHTDPRFQGDGDMSVGRLENLRLSTNRQTLIGDYVGVPLWLAKVLPSAYPRRSIEGEWGHVFGTAGNSFEGFYLTAVALLGAVYPAIGTLEDLEAFWKGEDPPMYDATTGGILDFNQAIAAAKGDNVPRLKRVNASATADDIRTAYYAGLDGSQMWWWIRAMYVDPPELIVDDDEGSLFRVPYTVNPTDDDQEPSITFGEAQKVAVKYVNVAAAAPDGNRAPGAPQPAAVWSARDESRGAIMASGDQPGDEGERTVNREQLCESLGLAKDASDDDLNAALETVRNAGPSNPAAPHNPAAPGPGTPGAPTPTGQPASNPGNPTNPTDPTNAPQPYDQATDTGGTPAPVAANGRPAVPAGMVLVDEAAWAEVRQGAEIARQMAATAAKSRRDDTIRAAIKAGKFPKARKEHYEKMWDADPEGTAELVASMADGMIPVEARGSASGDLDGAENPPSGPAYPPGWRTPTMQERERRMAAAASGQNLGD